MLKGGGFMFSQLSQLLRAYPKVPVLDIAIDDEPSVVMDFGPDNPAMNTLDTGDIKAFRAYVDGVLAAGKSRIGLGGYNEDRVVYRHSRLFEGESARTIHLGVDFWVPAGTAVLVPLDAIIHSVGDNAGSGNYGPTVILEHQLGGQRFYTLYGHLDTGALTLQIGSRLSAGQQLTMVGDAPDNGNWPPHLHFQIISDLGGRSGDYPGVCTRSEREKYLEICPDPVLLLKLKALGWR